MLTISAELSCSSDDASHPSTEAGTELDGTAGDGGDEASLDVVSTPTQAMVRFAALSPDAPAVDICLALRGTGAFKGPLLAQLASAAPGANAPGLSFTNLSGYLAIDPGTYDLRLVAAGSASCTPGAAVLPEAGTDASPVGDANAGADAADIDANAGGGADASGDADIEASAQADAASPEAGTPALPALPLPPDVTDLPPVVAGGFTTVLLAGDLAPVGGDAPFRAIAVTDDSALAGGGASLRAINALPGVMNADFGFGSAAASWLPLFTDVRFGAASLTLAASQGKVDANGYVTIAPFGPGVFSVRASGDGGPEIVSSQTAAVTLGTVATVLAAGGKSGDSSHPPVLIICEDNAPAGGVLGACSVLPSGS